MSSSNSVLPRSRANHHPRRWWPEPAEVAHPGAAARGYALEGGRGFVLEEDPSTRPAVLVLDDDEDMRFIVCSTLRRVDPEPRFFHHETSSLEDARATLKRCALENRPVLLLCDFRMPLMDGIEFSRSILDLRRQTSIRIIVLSSLMGRDGVERAKDAGVDAVVEKPFSSTDWRRLLATILEEWTTQLAGMGRSTQP